MRRRRAAGSTRLACALRGRFFCFLVSRPLRAMAAARSGSRGLFRSPRGRAPPRGRRCDAGVSFSASSPERAFGFRRVARVGRPNRCYALGWWRAAAPARARGASARSAAESQQDSLIILRKTPLLASRRPSLRASAALSTELTTASLRSSDLGTLPDRRSRRRLWPHASLPTNQPRRASCHSGIAATTLPDTVDAGLFRVSSIPEH